MATLGSISGNGESLPITEATIREAIASLDDDLQKVCGIQIQTHYLFSKMYYLSTFVMANYYIFALNNKFCSISADKIFTGKSGKVKLHFPSPQHFPEPMFKL